MIWLILNDIKYIVSLMFLLFFSKWDKLSLSLFLNKLTQFTSKKRIIMQEFKMTLFLIVGLSHHQWWTYLLLDIFISYLRRFGICLTEETFAFHVGLLYCFISTVYCFYNETCLYIETDIYPNDRVIGWDPPFL